jgi:hypothetical protein
MWTVIEFLDILTSTCFHCIVGLDYCFERVIWRLVLYTSSTFLMIGVWLCQADSYCMRHCGSVEFTYFAIECNIKCDKEMPHMCGITVFSTCAYCRISLGCCGRYTPAEVLSFCLSFFIVCIWILTGHWLLMDGQYNSTIFFLNPVSVVSNSQ